MEIRAVQASALTDALDRELPADHPENIGLPEGCVLPGAGPKRLEESAASLAHRYALSREGISTVVLGVKNRGRASGMRRRGSQRQVGP